MKLNLGCGKDIKEGYINLDKWALGEVDVVHNLNLFPYPFKDNIFDEILCSHLLEHVNDLIKVMEELHRMLLTGLYQSEKSAAGVQIRLNNT